MRNRGQGRIPPERWNSSLRATFLHPDGRQHRTPRGAVYVESNDEVVVKQSASPSWFADAGVEVVVADRDGGVVTAFTVSEATQYQDACALRA